LTGQNSGFRLSYPFIFFLTTMIMLAIFALIVVGISLILRDTIKNQIISRDAETLYLMSLHLQDRIPVKLQKRADIDLHRNALKTSNYKGIIGVQFYDTDGNHVDSIPANLIPTKLDPSYLSKLRRFKPVSKFYEQIWLDTLYLDDIDSFLSETSAALLEVVIPIHDPNSNILLGITQYWIDGSSMSQELENLNENLLYLIGIAFGAGAILISLTLFLSFRVLQKNHLSLQKRSAELQRANQELSLASKMSAVGAITSHLMHGLKNQIAGLKDFVSDQPQAASINDQEHSDQWQQAIETTQNIQLRIQDVVSIIQDETFSTDFQVSLPEIEQILLTKVEKLANQQDVTLRSSNFAKKQQFRGREANIIILILENLTRNALEATEKGNAVELKFEKKQGELVFSVKDEGHGLPVARVRNPFEPGVSSKRQGSGIGLAISYHLSKQINGFLNLDETSAKGSCFSLHISSSKKENL